MKRHAISTRIHAGTVPHIMKSLEQPAVFPKSLTMSWWWAYPPFAILEARYLYELTWLTYTGGAQNIGFTFVHQLPELLILGYIGWFLCIIWLIFAFINICLPRPTLSLLNKVQFGLTALTLLLHQLPIEKLVLKLR